MEPILFDLVDGYQDAQGVTHKSVKMHRLTMKEQIAIKSDIKARELIGSPYSLASGNQVNRLFAYTDLQQFYCIVFKQTVDQIGTIERDQLRSLNAFESLTSRDIDRMIGYQNGVGQRMISVDAVLKILSEVGLPEEVHTQFKDKMGEELGEAIEAARA